MIHTYRGNKWQSRLICLLMAFMLLLPALSTQAAPAFSSKYYYTTANNVMFRPEAGTSDYIDKLTVNWPLEKIGETTVDSVVWYQVKGNTPGFPNREFTGFIMSEYLRMMSEGEEAAFLAGTKNPGTTQAPTVTLAPGDENKLSNQAVVTISGAKLMNGIIGDDYIEAYLPGTRMTILDTPSDTVNGRYKVQVQNYTGYMDAANLRVLTLSEANVQTTATPTQQAGYVKITKHNVNLRKTPGGESMTQIPINTVLSYFGAPTTRAGYQWVYILHEGNYGYVRGDCYIFTDAAGSPGTGPIPTAAPSIAPPPEATQVPDATTGNIRVTKGGVNLRKTPGGESLLQMERGLILPYTGNATLLGGYQWIYVTHSSGVQGYVRSDCYEFTGDAGGGIVPTPTPQPQPDAIVGSITTTIGNLNVRTAPSLNSTTFIQLPNAGVSFPYKGLVTSGGRQWYHIVYENQSAYIDSNFAKITGAPIPTTPPDEPVPTIKPENLSSTAVTTMSRVIVRESGDASSKNLTNLYKKGTVARLTGVVNTSGGYLWRQVKAGGVTGFIRGDLLRILSKAEEALLDNTGSTELPPEASYRTLVRGDTGADVTRLQTELAVTNFLVSSAVTGVYNPETVEAVKKFQLAAGLFVDGIAGPSTQHKMYGTVPEGTNNPGGTADPEDLPVEKANWSVVDPIWTRGTTAVLTDVKTGLSFRAKRWAGGTHADVEPLTAADTAVMCKIYGVKNSQEILAKNLYQRKPFWVTVGGHTFAASVYGVPHNYPAGDTIPNNDYNGQFCVHFVNSRTHNNPNNPDPQHQAAIQEAYDKAPVKK